MKRCFYCSRIVYKDYIDHYAGEVYICDKCGILNDTEIYEERIKNDST